MKPGDIPNLLTVLRILLTIPVFWLLLRQQYVAALILFAVAGVSDGLDGFLAKQFGWQSRLGALLDPIADKLLLVSCYLVLGWLGDLPLWLAGVVVLRDVVIVGGALVYHFRIQALQASPSSISKINTVLQILLVLVVVVHKGLFAMPPTVVQALTVAVLFSTVASGASYVWEWSRRAIAAKRR